MCEIDSLTPQVFTQNWLMQNVHTSLRTQILLCTYIILILWCLKQIFVCYLTKVFPFRNVKCVTLWLMFNISQFFHFVINRFYHSFCVFSFTVNSIIFISLICDSHITVWAKLTTDATFYKNSFILLFLKVVLVNFHLFSVFYERKTLFRSQM